MTSIEDDEKIESANEKSASQDSKDAGKTNPRRCSFPPGTSVPGKNKHDNHGQSKSPRKRVHSFPPGSAKFFHPNRRRKKEAIVRPTKFLLGGNITDPLNLNCLQDEEINRAMNAVTPKSSPLPTPKYRQGEVEVITPQNINDPLNLIDCEDDAKYDEQFVSPCKKSHKSHHRKRKHSSSSATVKDESTDSIINKESKGGNLEESTDEAEKDTSKEFRAALNFVESTCTEESSKPEKKIRKVDVKDKIVSPVIPQPGAWRRHPHGHSSAPVGSFNRFRYKGHNKQQKKQQPQETPKFNGKNAKFQYGNYYRYYGYRNPSHEVDPRLACFSDWREIFKDKDVLDIGCNIGHVTLLVARDFGARSAIGLDIDRKLIEIARKNVKHYVTPTRKTENQFPMSMQVLYGGMPIDFTPSSSSEKKFPHNVTFVQGNYVPETDVLLQTEQQKFDVILCLSLTKWIHLNWGDAGLKRAFKRMYAQLRPGGKLILEAQSWDSYKRKKKLTETIYRNYNNIEFMPDQFKQYLLSSEIGFSKYEMIGKPCHKSKGFQRPIHMYIKDDVPVHSAESTITTATATAMDISENIVPTSTTVGSNSDLGNPVETEVQSTNNGESSVNMTTSLSSGALLKEGNKDSPASVVKETEAGAESKGESTSDLTSTLQAPVSGVDADVSSVTCASDTVHGERISDLATGTFHVSTSLGTSTSTNDDIDLSVGFNVKG